SLPSGAVLVGTDRGVAEVVSMPQSGNGAERVRISVETAGDVTLTKPVDVIAFLPRGVEVNVGDRIALAWSFEHVDTLAPGFGGWVTSQGVVGVVYVYEVTIEARGDSWERPLVDARRLVSDRLQRLIPGDAGALASGIVTGDDSRMSAEVNGAFQRTGTAHVTAVSGQNVAMLIGLAALLFPARWRKRAVMIQAALVVLIVSYALMVVFNPPSVRAAFFAILVLFGARFGRRPDLFTILALVTAGMVLWNPGMVQSISFWLSVVSSAALVTCLEHELGAGWKRKVGGVIVGLAAAQLSTVPITLAAFGTWSIGSIFANLIIAPIVALAFPVTFVVALVAVASPTAARWIGWFPEILLRFVIDVVTEIDRTFGVVDFAASRELGVIAIAVPCGMGLLVLSGDARRWLDRVRQSPFRESSGGRAAIAGASMGLGLAIAVAILGFH
ncbi:MAG TPA: ComEC/Rec2 family competence protein, partial [Thermomicrobiales bacterium]|nr:ComEC/Rec2 family competence protein [Thermomicrobiales bacterium]